MFACLFICDLHFWFCLYFIIIAKLVNYNLAFPFHNLFPINNISQYFIALLIKIDKIDKYQMQSRQWANKTY